MTNKFETSEQLHSRSTRRVVVATGAKLAYAAPLVATSLTLSALNVAATHSPGHVCTSGSLECGDEHGQGCVSLCSTENEPFCAEGLQLGTCTSDADCREGRCEFDEFGGVCTEQPCDSTADCDLHCSQAIPVGVSCRCWLDPFSGRGRICRRECGSG